MTVKLNKNDLSVLSREELEQRFRNQWETIVRQSEELERAAERLDQARRQYESDTRSLTERLAEARRRHESDIRTIGERLIEEAEERGWCSEYDEIIEDVNRSLVVELPHREREYVVQVATTVYATVAVTARNEAEAEDALDRLEVLNQLAENLTYGDLDYEVVEVEEV